MPSEANLHNLRKNIKHLMSLSLVKNKINMTLMTKKTNMTPYLTHMKSKTLLMTILMRYLSLKITFMMLNHVASLFFTFIHLQNKNNTNMSKIMLSCLLTSVMCNILDQTVIMSFKLHLFLLINY